ncbi:MAG: hypothetical protein IJO56_05745 [Oscillospiraceae bacterium]|nr:hypothetical protein [Oscillospiraceae bacterium]
MPKCAQCGKSGWLLHIEKGICNDCTARNRLAAQLQAEQKRIMEENSPSFLLDKVLNKKIERPGVLNGIPMVYKYMVPMVEVDRNALYHLTQQNIFRADLELSNEGNVYLVHSGKQIARADNYTPIISDWLKKGDPYICQFVSFKKGSEGALLLLYRDDEAKLKNCTVTIAKLTSCMTESKQENIGLLERNQKLFVEEDDDGKLYVRDIHYNELGRMPEKFNRMYEDGTLRGVFFDHTEITENSNGEDREIPFVRFYHE